jgi:hypothetical protein
MPGIVEGYHLFGNAELGENITIAISGVSNGLMTCGGTCQ